jgi:hypothetical protein
MTALTETDLHFVVTRIPSDVRALMKTYGLFLAGGFIRATIAGEKVADIDLFGKDEPTLKLAAAELAGDRKGRVHTTQNALTVLTPMRVPVQLITRWLYNNAHMLAKSFDFTVAQAVIYWEPERPPQAPNEKLVPAHWASTCHPEFYADLAAKRLVYTSPVRNEDAGGSLLRVRKFLPKGYNIQAPSLAAVIARLMEGVDMQKVSEKLTTATHTHEQALAAVIEAKLREVDPLIILDGLQIVDEHEPLLEGVG